MQPHEIQQIRASLGESQLEFAERLGLSKRTIQQWEHGHRAPGARVKQKMRALQEPKAQRRARVMEAIEAAAKRAEDDQRTDVAAKLRELIAGY